jgi:hypothetical protein
MSDSSTGEWVRVTATEARRFQKRLGVADKVRGELASSVEVDSVLLSLQQVTAHVSEQSLRSAIDAGDIAFFVNHSAACLVACAHAAATFGLACALQVAETLQRSVWLSQQQQQQQHGATPAKAALLLLYEAMEFAILLASEMRDACARFLRQRVQLVGGQTTTVSSTLQLDFSSKSHSLSQSIAALQHEADAKRLVLQHAHPSAFASSSSSSSSSSSNA